MQLRQSEAFGVENHHHRSVRHVDAHLYHRCGDENLCLSVNKLLHLLVLLSRFHLAVHLAEAEFREHLLQYFKPLLKVLYVELLALLDERKHDIHLSALFYLLSDARVQTCGLVVVFVYRHYRFPSRRQLVDNAHVEVAVYCHCEGSRYRCGGHHEHMGRVLAFAP